MQLKRGAFCSYMPCAAVRGHDWESEAGVGVGANAVDRVRVRVSVRACLSAP